MEKPASDSPAKGTRLQTATAEAKAASGEAAAAATEDVRILSSEEVVAAAARAPEVPRAALLALIEHFNDTGYKVKEGTGNSAEKKLAWLAALEAFNAAAATAGVKYRWTVPQLKTLWNNKKETYHGWFKKAGETKSGRENFWAQPENAGKKPFFYDSMDRLLAARPATAPPIELEVGGGGGVAKRGSKADKSDAAAKAAGYRNAEEAEFAANLGARPIQETIGDDEDETDENPERREADDARAARRKQKADKRAAAAGTAKEKAETIKKEEKEKQSKAKKEDAKVLATALADAFGPLFGTVTRSLDAATAALKPRKKSGGGSSGRRSAAVEALEDEDEDDADEEASE